MLKAVYQTDEKRHHIKQQAESLEKRLYNSAKSSEDYSDWKTLTSRTQLLSMSTDHPLFQALDRLRQMLMSRNKDCSQDPQVAAAQKMWLHSSRCANPKCTILHCNETRNLLMHRCKCEGSCELCDLIDFCVPPMKQFLQNLQKRKDLRKKHDAQTATSEREAATALINLRSLT